MATRDMVKPRVVPTTARLASMACQKSHALEADEQRPSFGT